MSRHRIDRLRLHPRPTILSRPEFPQRCVVGRCRSTRQGTALVLGKEHRHILFPAREPLFGPARRRSLVCKDSVDVPASLASGDQRAGEFAKWEARPSAPDLHVRACSHSLTGFLSGDDADDPGDAYQCRCQQFFPWWLHEVTKERADFRSRQRSIWLQRIDTLAALVRKPLGVKLIPGAKVRENCIRKPDASQSSCST